MVRFITLLCATLILGGCATKADLIALQSLGSEKRSFDFFDLRPADQFRTRTVREENGDRIYYGDDVVIPSRTELLADQLQAALGKELKGRTVTITTFRLQTMQYTNRGGPGYTSTGNPVADLIGVAIGRELMAATTRSKQLGAYIQIVAKLDEREVSVDASTYVSAKTAAPELAEHVQKAISQFVQKTKEILIPELSDKAESVAPAKP